MAKIMKHFFAIRFRQLLVLSNTYTNYKKDVEGTYG